MNVTSEHYMILSALLFTIGALGVVLRRNILIIFMSIELMLNAVNLVFITIARYMNAIEGQIVVIFVMGVAAAEVAVGLAIIIAVYRERETTDIDDINLMKG